MRSAGTVSQIAVAVIVALAVGSTSPWWWKELFPEAEKASQPGPSQAPVKEAQPSSTASKQSSGSEESAGDGKAAEASGGLPKDAGNQEGSGTQEDPQGLDPSTTKKAPDLRVPYVLLGVRAEDVRGNFPAAEESTSADGLVTIKYAVDLPLLDEKPVEVAVLHSLDKEQFVERTIWRHGTTDLYYGTLGGCGIHSSNNHPSIPKFIDYFSAKFGPQIGQTTKRRIPASEMEFPPSLEVKTEIIQSFYLFKPKSAVIKLVQEEYAVARGIDWSHVCRVRAVFEFAPAQD